MIRCSLKAAALAGASAVAFAASAAFAPDVLRFADGSQVRAAEDWTRRRAEVAAAVLPLEYGHLPARPADVVVDEISHSELRRESLDLDGILYRFFHVSCEMDGKPVTFALHLWTPASNGRLGTIVEGDGCWQYLTDKVKREILRRGYAVAHFNRCEIAKDDRSSGDSTLLKWAWTYHRAIDALIKAEPRLDPARFAVTGHSRGGKAALLAGATDERIWAVGDNCSGCGGSAPYRNAPAEAEHINQITANFPYWFAPGWKDWYGREAELPFDQHFLEALVAPRRLFVRHAEEDKWANPTGAKELVEDVRRVWDLFGRGKDVAYSLREGGHSHKVCDYEAFLDFLGGGDAD